MKVGALAANSWHWLPWGAGALLLLGGAVYLIYRLFRRFKDCWPQEPPENGIRVGAPKVYDNRSLSLMLEQLRDQLRNIESIDAGVVTASVGTQQGEQRTDLDAGLNVKLPLGMTKPRSAKEDAEDSSATPRKAAAPAGKEDDQSGLTSASPFKWGERGADLLRDQMNLSYEIFNLRLLLERALSDRLLQDKTRVQAVVGIPISIDPPPYAAGCAATVEVRLTVAAGQTGPSLVAMFPQQETYNTWGVDRRSFHTAATGSAPAGSLGGETTFRGESRYLHRRLDTVAIERESGENELIIAWQFRPQAGEHTVSSGLRQMLTVLALSSPDEGRQSFELQVFVRSSWQRWHESIQTAGRGVGWRGLFSDRPTHHGVWGAHGTVLVPTTELVEHDLGPTITGIEWLRVGATKAGVVVTGTNFFAGTTVVMGDTILGPESGLTIKSERSLQLLVPLSSLLSDGLLNGRYGPSMKLLNLVAPGLQPMRIQGTAIEPAENNQSYRLTVWLETRDGKRLDWENFNHLPDPIITINGEVIPEVLVFSPGDTDSSAMGTVRVTAQYISSNSIVLGVRWPFNGDEWTLHYQTYEPRHALAAARVRGEAKTSILLSGGDFADSVTVVVDRGYQLDVAGPLRRFANDLLQLELSNELADQYEQIFVTQPNGSVLAVPLAPVKRPASPCFDQSAKPPRLNVAAGGVVELGGIGLDKVMSVTVDDLAVPFTAYAGGTALAAMIHGGLIPAPGVKQIVCTLNNGGTLKAPVLIIGT